MHLITLDIDNLLFWAGAIGVICTAIVWIIKGMGPLLRPFKEIRELKEHTHTCAMKFENDQQHLMEMRENEKMIMKSLMLLLKHAETGNCTGEVGAGRKELENYLIDKD